jgi:hypothetical protein
MTSTSYSDWHHQHHQHNTSFSYWEDKREAKDQDRKPPPLETKKRAGGIGGPQTKTLEETKLHKTEFWIRGCFLREKSIHEKRGRDL